MIEYHAAASLERGGNSINGQGHRMRDVPLIAPPALSKKKKGSEWEGCKETADIRLHKEKRDVCRCACLNIHTCNLVKVPGEGEPDAMRTRTNSINKARCVP